MLKRLTVFALFVLVFIFVTHAQVNKKRNKSSPKHQANAQQTVAAQQSVPLVEVQTGSSENKADNDHKLYQWHELYAPANVPNWALAAVALWAGMMALRTLGAIKRQADLMEAQAGHMESQTALIKRQGEIQAAGMKQWVDVEARGIEDGDAAVRGEFRLLFQAVNNTDFPLTIRKIVTKVGLWPRKWECSSVAVSVTLPPTKWGGAGYPFYATVTLIGQDESITEIKEHFSRSTGRSTSRTA